MVITINLPDYKVDNPVCKDLTMTDRDYREAIIKSAARWLNKNARFLKDCLTVTQSLDGFTINIQRSDL